MEAIALVFTKFSEELLGAQVALLCFASALAAYWFVLRKKKKQSAEWVPAALVRAYLDRVRSDERDIRLKLFGEETQPLMSLHSQAPLASALGAGDPTLAREVDALRAQLALSDQKALEFDRMMNALRAEKAALEQKLAAAPAGSASSDTAVKELAELKAKLQEYEVIEDDLANLKKFQKENEALKQKVEQYEKGGAAPAAVVSAPVAAAPTLTVVSGGPAVAEVKTVISGAAPAAAPEPAPVAAVPTPETNTNVLAPITPTIDVAPPPAGEKSAKQKEEELLSEFEKMLAS